MASSADHRGIVTSGISTRMVTSSVFTQMKTMTSTTTTATTMRPGVSHPVPRPLSLDTSLGLMVRPFCSLLAVRPAVVRATAPRVPACPAAGFGGGAARLFG